MSTRVIYLTEAFPIKNQAGKQYEHTFVSLEEAKAASLPAGYVTAVIEEGNGYHIYSVELGWQFHGKKTEITGEGRLKETLLLDSEMLKNEH